MTKEKNDTKEQINLEEELTSKIEEYQALINKKTALEQELEKTSNMIFKFAGSIETLQALIGSKETKNA
tara:strand:+ start:869 stop:1075 length:207 start_codon:yes stop_codon:yes gene_type:complete